MNVCNQNKTKNIREREADNATQQVIVKFPEYVPGNEVQEVC